MTIQTIFITGASGFIGRNLVESVIKDNSFQIVCLIKNDDIIGRKILDKYQVEIITEEDLPLYTKKLDICFHLASYGVKYGDRDLDTMIDVNVLLSTKIMRFVSRCGCKYFFNAGSCFEYGESLSVYPITEDSDLKPQDIYAASKLACENILNVYAKLLGVKLITFRLFSVFGKYESATRLFPQIIASGINCKELELTAGEQIRDYMDVQDVAKILHIFAIKKNLISFDVINVCSGVGTTIKDFVIKVAKSCGFDLSLFKFGCKPYRQNESMFFVGNNARLMEIIGNINIFVDDQKIINSFNSFKNNN